jgi:hypothetical protein
MEFKTHRWVYLRRPMNRVVQALLRPEGFVNPGCPKANVRSSDN